MLDKQLADEYLEGNFGTPYLGDEKTEDFFLSVAKSFLADYTNNRTSVPWNWSNSGRRSYGELRDYARGKQSVEKYKQIVDAYVSTELAQSQGKDKASFMNISWEPVKVLPKFRAIIIKRIMDIEFSADVQCIDPQSVSEKKMRKRYEELLLEEGFKQFAEQAEKLGAKVPKSDFNFLSKQQINVVEKAGYFKIDLEIAMEKAISMTQNISHLPEVRLQVIEDLIDIAHACWETYIDNEGVKVRYVDPAMVIAPYSTYHDGRNIDKYAVLRYKTLAELRRETDLEYSELSNLVKTYGGRYGNRDVPSGFDRAVRNGSRDNMGDNDFFDEYNDFKVLVMDMKFIAPDVLKQTKVKREDKGNLVVNNVSKDYKLSKRDEKKGKKVIETAIEYRYRLSMVVGTDVIFDYGKDYNIGRKGENGNKQVDLGFFQYRLDEESVIDRCVGFIDDISIAVFKKRNALARVPPSPRMQIEVAVLDNIGLGSTKMSRYDVLKMYNQTGVLMYQSLTDDGEINSSANTNPISTIPSGIVEDVTTFNNEIQFNFDMIRQVTGVNEIADASTPQSRTGLGVAELAIDTSNATMGTIVFAMRSLHQRMYESVVSRWQAKSLDGFEGITRSLGQKSYDILKLTKDVYYKNFGITIEVLPSQREREELLADLRALKDLNVSQGRGGISPSSYLMIVPMIKAGQITLAQLSLAEAQKEQEMKDAEEQNRRDEANTQRQIQSAQASEQAKMQSEASKHQMELDRMAKQFEYDYQLKMLDIQGKSEHIEQQNQGKLQEEQWNMAMVNTQN